MLELGFEWAGTIVAIIGAILNARAIRGGLAFWLVSNTCIMTFAVMINAWGLFTLFLVYSCISAYGLWDWKRKGIGG